MSELRSVVERLRAESLVELPDVRIEEDITELRETMEQLEVERLRRLAEVDRRRLFEREGTCRRRRGSPHTSASRGASRAER